MKRRTSLGDGMIRIYREDCFDWVPENVKKGTVPLIITDPPYGAILKNKWDQEWTIGDQWKLTRLLDYLLMPGGTAYIWGGIGRPGNRLFFRWLSLLEKKFPSLTLYNLITWRKKRAYGKKDDFLFTREECAMIVKGQKPKTFHIPLLDEKRGYAGFNSLYPAKSEFLRRTNVWTDITELFRGKIHDAEKPSRLAEVMIETSSNEGDTVFDLFAGSGSTGVAALNTHRNAVLIEKSDCKMHVKHGETYGLRGVAE